MDGDRKPRRWRPSPSATVVGSAVAMVCAAWGAGAASGGWLGQALRSPRMLVYGGMALASGVGLYLIGGVMFRLGRSRTRPGATDGTSAIEFVLLFPWALILALLMIQSTMLVSQNVVLHYSAYAAARAAVVWVPEKLSYEEPRNVVTDPSYSEKVRHIRMAAVMVLTGVSANKPGVGGSGGAGDSSLHQAAYERLYSLYAEPIPGWINRMYPHKYQYAQKFTEVDLVPPRVAPAYGAHEDLTVTVRHTLYLGVPYARRIFSWDEDGRDLGNGEYGTAAEATCTLTNHGVEDEIDVEVFPRYVGRGEEEEPG